MANQISVLNPANWRPIVQDFLNNNLIATAIANTEVRSELNDGDTVNFPQMGDLTTQDYVQGTDLTISQLYASQSSLVVNKSKAVTFPLDPVQEKQAKAKYGMVMAKQSAFRLANQIDQTLLADGCTNAFTNVAGGTLTTPTMFSLMTDNYARLARQNAVDGELFAVLDPERISLLAQTFVANGFTKADTTLEHNFKGMASEFNVYSSNNLPSTVTMTVAVQPTAGDTFTLYGTQFIFRATGTAALPGEISLGANVAATQANILLAINGTGTPGASTYIDFTTAATVDSRAILSNNVAAASAFATNVTTITGFGKIGLTGTWSSGSNLFGTETTKILFGRMGAISLGMQMMPSLYIREEPRQLVKNYITHTLYGTKTFSRDAKRLVAVTINA